MARLLALGIFYEPDLAFTKGLCATDEPDLWVVGPDGRPQLWIEVGLPDAERIIKASRHAEKVVLLACGKALTNWDQQHLPKLEKIANLTIVSIDQEFISILASRLERSIAWSVTITEKTIYLTIGDSTFETAIQIKAGSI